MELDLIKTISQFDCNQMVPGQTSTNNGDNLVASDLNLNG
jgi:hypothetical protein